METIKFMMISGSWNRRERERERERARHQYGNYKIHDDLRQLE
jgi:hypothetical protein